MSRSSTMNMLFLSFLLLCSGAKQSLANVREIYIAAVEFGWDYHQTKTVDSSSELRGNSPRSKDGTKHYMKAIYWEYTDSSFSTPKAKPPWMGIQGPTIRAEVNDKVVVHFKNFASHPYSVYPIGISYWKQSEGAGYEDATSRQEKEDDAVASGGYYRYVWDIQPINGPTKTDSDCLTYSYSSHVDIVRDFNSGLIGALLVCKAGALQSDGQQKVPEFILLFAVFDETKSWYGESGMSLERVQKIREKKLYHTINGYVNSTLPGLKMCKKNNVFWHLIGMGSSPEIHSINFQKHTLQVKHHRKVSLEVTSMTFATAEMKPVAAGKFLISCLIHSHRLAGMNAYFTIEDCPEPPASLEKRYAIHTDDYEYDIALDDVVSTLMVRSTVKLKPKLWIHYIAAEEITWDYAPNLNERDRASEYLKKGPQHLGKEYKKAVYAEYTDKSFTQLKRVPGVVGPVLRGEVEDKIMIVFKNRASHPFNIYPIGLTSIGQEGKVLKDLRDHAVKPNETFTYSWTIAPEDGPTKADPRCLTRLYQSTIDPVRDVASGLMGPLVVCYRKTLDKRGNVLMSDKEKHLMFTVFDENKSWYIEENIQKYSQDPSKLDPTDPEFYNSNVMYNVNGLMYNNLRFKVCLGDVTFWHVLNVGTQSNFLSVYFTGNTFERDKVYETVLTLFPMTGETVSMEMETLGEWDISALDDSLKNRGMSARYTVLPCGQNLLLVDSEDDYYFEDYLNGDIARSAGRKNMTLAVRVCRRPVRNSTQTSSTNSTESNSGQPLCVVKHITLSQDGGNAAFSQGDVPEEVLRELERDIEVSATKRQERSLSAENRPMAIQKEDGGDPLLLLPELAGLERNRTFTDPDGPTSTPTHYGTAELEEDYVHTLLPGEATENGHGDDSERIKEDSLTDSHLKHPRRPGRAQDQKSPPILAWPTVDTKSHDWKKLLSQETRGKSTGEDKKRIERGNEDLKKNLPLEQEDLRQTGMVHSSPSHMAYSNNALDKQPMVAQALDSQANFSNNSNNTWSEKGLEYDDYSDEENTTVTSSDFEEDLDIRSTEGKYRNYYIAAEEIMWDYGIKKPLQLIEQREMVKGIRKFLPKYKKVVFRAYLDKDFKHLAPRGELEEHLGIMGPVIRAEINDFVTVTFKNLASKPFSFHLHGVFDKRQGVEFGESPAEAVQPDEMRRYNWKITKKQGPSPKEFDCKAWPYYSNLNMERDIHSGLIGPLIVCKPGTLHSTYDLQPGIQEYHLLFTIFDETKSWYFDENLSRFCSPPCRVEKEDPQFKIKNKFSAINGYVAETLPGLLAAQHEVVRWHLLNMGSNGEFHAVHFHGLPFTVRKDQEYRMGIYNLYPGISGTVEMRPVMVGTWMVECTIGEHQASGMRARLLVYNPKCAEPMGMRTGRIADFQISESGHYGDWESRLARLELSGTINAWSGVDNLSWIQVDLLRPMLIQGVHTQGAKHGFSESFIIQFTLSYSLDMDVWKTYKGNSTKPVQIFSGNMDGSKVKENYFSPPILGRYIRLQPLRFNKRPSLRMELFGCDLNSCSMPMGMEKMFIENHRISASSFLQKMFLSWSPSLARLNLEGSANAWRPKTNNPFEWIQVDFQEVKRVTGVITQGARSLLTHMMVTEFTVSVSSDGRVWTSLLEEKTPREKVFQGNNKHDEEVLNIFEPPLFTRYIRINPKGWYNDIALRLEFLGCDTQQRL